MSVRFKVLTGIIAAASLGGGYTAVANAQAAANARTVWTGVYTNVQAQRGRAYYNQRCTVCHGAGLEGADVNPALAGAAFTGKWRGQSVGQLVSRIRTTMPLDEPGSMTATQAADVTAYLLMRNRYPAGAAELPRGATQQNTIRITAR